MPAIAVAQRRTYRLMRRNRGQPRSYKVDVISLRLLIEIVPRLRAGMHPLTLCVSYWMQSVRTSVPTRSVGTIVLSIISPHRTKARGPVVSG